MTRVMPGVQAITLAERRGEARELDERIRRHGGDCRECRPRLPCGAKQAMTAEVREIRADIKSWFEPGPDQDVLF